MLRVINKTSVAARRSQQAILKTGGNNNNSIDPVSLFIYFFFFGNNSVRAFAASTNVKEEIEVFIDGKSVMIEQGSALIQACEKAGADVNMRRIETLYTAY